MVVAGGVGPERAGSAGDLGERSQVRRLGLRPRRALEHALTHLPFVAVDGDGEDAVLAQDETGKGFDLRLLEAKPGGEDGFQKLIAMADECVAVAVLGLFAYNRLRVEQMPDVSLPFALVLTTYPGASPEVVEADVTKPLEYAINTVSGVKLIRSNSLEGQSQVFAEFRLDTDMTRAIQDVRDKVALARPGFPREVKDPLVIRADSENTQPVVALAALNALSENVTYRAAPLATLEPAIGPGQAMLLTAVLFGVGHFYGVPYGLVGVIMAGALGWILNKTMLETGGFFWPWFIHFCQDALVFSFMALGAVAAS